jgi:hypothetical protein
MTYELNTDDCPICGAKAGETCRFKSGKRLMRVHLRAAAPTPVEPQERKRGGDIIVDHRCDHHNGCGYCASLITQSDRYAIEVLRAKNATIHILRERIGRTEAERDEEAEYALKCDQLRWMVEAERDRALEALRELEHAVMVYGLDSTSGKPEEEQTADATIALFDTLKKARAVLAHSVPGSDEE